MVPPNSRHRELRKTQIRSKENSPNPARSLSSEEASALTGIGLTAIRRAASSGALDTRKHGKRIIILPDDLKAWLKSPPGIGKKMVSEKKEDA
jgi:Helix-turn-helix domain